MKEYIIIELENNNKYAVIDLLEYQEKKYLLLSKVSQEEKNISNKFKIYTYNEKNNKINELETNYEYENIKNIFEERLKNQKNKLDNIEITNIVKVKVTNINGYNYTLELKNGEKTTKNIEVYSNKKINVNDYIYINKSTLKEDMLQYGKIINKDAEIIKVINEKEQFYLQRYFG